MSYPLQTHLRQIVETVQIPSDEMLIFNGRPYATIEDAWHPSSQTDHPLISRLRSLLYARCYCRALIPGRLPPLPYENEDPRFLHTLTAATNTQDREDWDKTVSHILSSGYFMIQSHTKKRGPSAAGTQQEDFDRTSHPDVSNSI